MRFTATRSTIKKLQEKVKQARYKGNIKMLIKKVFGFYTDFIDSLEKRYGKN